MRLILKEIELKGFKSIGNEGQALPINDDVTVLIGANGVGKSNVVSFFQLLNHAMTGTLQNFIAENGFGDAFLYYGSKTTDAIEAKLRFACESNRCEYAFRLAYAAGDTLVYANEWVSQQAEGQPQPTTIALESGKRESQLAEVLSGNDNNETAQAIVSLVKKCQYYQFHDTTADAKIRKKVYLDDNKQLHNNAGNLAAFLYGIKHRDGGEPYYRRIVRYIQQVMPQFGDFVMEPLIVDGNYTALDWREKGSNHVFGVNQISDGTLRFMALATLLLQPPTSLPPIIIVDEPELGLHPTAISILAGMIKKASEHAQVVIATQSPRLLDEFDADKIVVIERDEQRRTSTFRHLSSKALKEWENYQHFSRLWEQQACHWPNDCSRDWH